AWGTAVVKPLYGSLGQGVQLIRAGRAAPAVLAALCRRHGALHMQRYAAPPGGPLAAPRDVRAFVVGDRVVAAIRRQARASGLPCNLARGGRAEPAQLDALTTSLAVRAARAVGLDYTGVDLVETECGPLVLEVNGTPGWRGLARITGRPVA